MRLLTEPAIQKNLGGEESIARGLGGATVTERATSGY